MRLQDVQMFQDPDAEMLLKKSQRVPWSTCFRWMRGGVTGFCLLQLGKTYSLVLVVLELKRMPIVLKIFWVNGLEVG